MSTRLDNMVQTALDSRRRYAIASSWRAEVMTPPDERAEVYVYHYDTLMFRLRKHDGEWYAYPINSGWGSLSDKQGTNKILLGIRCANVHSYKQLFEGMV